MTFDMDDLAFEIDVLLMKKVKIKQNLREKIEEKLCLRWMWQQKLKVDGWDWISGWGEV